MDATPTPVDLNKLKSILGNAKKLMKVTDEKFPKINSSKSTSNSSRISEHITTPMYDERDEREPEYGNTSELLSSKPREIQETQARDYTVEDIMNSKLPPIIKEAMIKNPIPKLSMPPSKFTLEGLEDLVEKPKSIVREVQTRPQSNMVSINKDELNELIDKRVNEVLAQMFARTITEQTIKKTVSTLMKEGKLLTTKKKIN